MFSDVEQKIKKRNMVLFSRDSESLQGLKMLIEQQKHRTLVMWALDCAKVPLAQFEKNINMSLGQERHWNFAQLGREAKLKCLLRNGQFWMPTLLRKKLMIEDMAHCAMRLAMLALPCMWKPML